MPMFSQTFHSFSKKYIIPQLKKIFFQNCFLLFFLDQYLYQYINHYVVHVILQDIEHQILENIHHHFLHYKFFIKSSLNQELSLIHSKLFNRIFCDNAQPYKLFKSPY